MSDTVVDITSRYDGRSQPVRVYRAGAKKRPLLVALHTWGYDHRQEAGDTYIRHCRDRGWHCLFPGFRGPNRTPEACGSPAAVQDVIDALDWALQNVNVDQRHVYCAGLSGGGHMALLAASLHPTRWTAVSVWSPITDLALWHAETIHLGLDAYTADIERVCGGPPGTNETVDGEYARRSPSTSLWRAHVIPCDINAGIRDGHGSEEGGNGPVPPSQGCRAFNELVRGAGRDDQQVPAGVMDAVDHDSFVPAWFEQRATVDLSYGRTIHMRRTSGLSRLTLFEGGHEILHNAAFEFLGGI